MHLPHRIRIETRVDTQDETTGIVTVTWAHFATVDAHYRPASVREFLAAGVEQAKVIGAFKIRPIDGVEQSMRIAFGGRFYRIVGVLPDHIKGTDYYTMPVTEIQNG